MHQDEEDESLRRYKEALLGSAVMSGAISGDGPARVTIMELRIVHDGSDDIVVNLSTPEEIEAVSRERFVVKQVRGKLGPRLSCMPES